MKKRYKLDTEIDIQLQLVPTTTNTYMYLPEQLITFTD